MSSIISVWANRSLFLLFMVTERAISLDEVLKYLPEENEEDDDDDSIKVAVIGKA